MNKDEYRTTTIKTRYGTYIINRLGGGTGIIAGNVGRDEGNGPVLTAALDAIESMVLAHTLAGVDTTGPAYVNGIDTALDAVVNNVEEG